jgi:hypothetical protein
MRCDRLTWGRPGFDGGKGSQDACRAPPTRKSGGKQPNCGHAARSRGLGRERLPVLACGAGPGVISRIGTGSCATEELEPKSNRRWPDAGSQPFSNASSEIAKKGHARRGLRSSTFGRGFDSRRLHHSRRPVWGGSCGVDDVISPSAPVLRTSRLGSIPAATPRHRFARLVLHERAPSLRSAGPGIPAILSRSSFQSRMRLATSRSLPCRPSRSTS